MKINKDSYQIPTHSLNITKSEYSLLYPFDKQANVAVEILNTHYPEITASSHWFRITMEITRDCVRGKSDGEMYAQLEVFKR